MSVLVTGAHGQLGSEICRLLSRFAVPWLRATGDLTDARHLRKQLLTIRPTVVVNTAAYNQVDRAETDSDACYAVNAGVPAHLAEVCRELDSTLVQISTSYVFGERGDPCRPWREDDEPAPLSVYGLSKLIGEEHARTVPRHFVVRTGCLVGHAPRGATNFVERMLQLARAGQPVRVVNDQICAPSYVGDLARRVLQLIQSDAPYGIYHLTHSGQTTWYDLAREAMKRTATVGDLQPLATSEFGAAAIRPRYSLLDCTKAADVGITPLPHWTHGLQSYLDRRVSSSPRRAAA